MKNLAPNNRVRSTRSIATILSMSLLVLAGCGTDHDGSEHGDHAPQAEQNSPMHHDEHGAHHSAESKVATAMDTSMSDTVMATVVSIDSASNRITLDHGALPTIGMEAMTMGFALDSGVNVAGLKPDDKVHATIEMQPGKGFVVTAISTK